MLIAEDWKYVQNQILSVTDGNDDLMTEIIEDTWPKLQVVLAADAAWTPVSDSLAPVRDAWLGTTSGLATAVATLAMQTGLFENKLNMLTVQPDPDTNSLAVQWESIVTSNVAQGGSVYNYLLPDARSGFSHGTYEQRIEYVQQFSTRLSEQTTKAALLALGPVVWTFASALVTLRTAQVGTEGTIDGLRGAQEPVRTALAQELHGVIGFGLWTWRANPVQVASLFDLELLRESQQDLPDAPADSAWTALTRTLSTTALPANATRLELWRLGPGGAPERLLIGATGALALTVPAEFTFTAGATYQLWLVARNGRGVSAPGPVQSWVA